MEYDVHCGTTAISGRDLPALARRICGDLRHVGNVREPSVASNLLTRRLTLTARVAADTPQTAITVAETAFLGHLREHGAECSRVGIQHADASPAVRPLRSARPC
jgi:hypothetical protein